MEEKKRNLSSFSSSEKCLIYLSEIVTFDIYTTLKRVCVLVVKM